MIELRAGTLRFEDANYDYFVTVEEDAVEIIALDEKQLYYYLIDAPRKGAMQSISFVIENINLLAQNAIKYGKLIVLDDERKGAIHKA